MNPDLPHLIMVNMMHQLAPAGWNITEAAPHQYLVITVWPISDEGKETIRGVFRGWGKVAFVDGWLVAKSSTVANEAL